MLISHLKANNSLLLVIMSIELLSLYYGPSVISVMVTKGGHPRGSRLYKTSKTIRRGVSQVT